MRILILTALAFMTAFSGSAQLSNYRFLREGGQISYLDPADTAVMEHTVSNDMVLPAKIALGFSFKFNGAFYDSVGISENGYIWFGPAQAEDLAGITNPILSNLPAGVKGVVSSFGVDLHPHVNTSLTTTIRSKKEMWIGRVDNTIIEWRNTSRFESLNDPAGEDTMGFQIQLYAFELDRIQISYGYEMGLNPNITSSLSVGAKGASNADFTLRTNTGASWDNTTAAANLQGVCTFSRSNNPSRAPHNYMSWVNDGVTGLNTLQAEDDFIIYPVPASDIIHIESENQQAERLSIYNMNGKLIKEVTTPGSAIAIDGLARGLYLVHIQTRDRMVVKKMIKE